MKKNGFAKFFLLITILVLAGFFLLKPKAIDVGITDPENQDATATIILVGDIMLDRGVELKIKENGGDWKWPFLNIADELKTADIVFGNLEGPISDKGEKVGSIYSFRMNPRAVEGLNFAGFNVLSVANNHMLDYGRQALEDTFARLENAGISYAGGGMNETKTNEPVIKMVNGIKIAFLAYTNLCPLSWKSTTEKSGIDCITMDDLEKVKAEIKTVKNVSDVLIVSLHSGTEYSQAITSFQIEFAHSAIDAGADLVVGHHPHVVQKSEIYKDKYIFYSLGNFVFDQDFSEETMQGQMIKILIENKKMTKVEPIDIYMNENFQPGLKKTFELPAPLSPEIVLSSINPAQGDTLFIRIEKTDVKEITGILGATEINFFKDAFGKWVGIAGIDAKKTPGNYKLTVNLSGGQKLEKNIEVTKRNFPITVLAFTPELEEQGYNATSVQETIASNDSVVLNKAFSTSSPTALFDKAFDYPLEKILDVGAFGNIRQSGNVSLQHLGVDLDAPLGTKVYAANDGVVKTTAQLINYGNTIIIDHGLGIFSLYLHLNEFKVKEGQKVAKNQVIAYSGNTGYSIEPHLHFSIRLNGASVDPLRFVRATQEGMSQ